MNALCLDYGTKRIGVAFARTPIAEPIEILQNTKKTPQESASAFVFHRLGELLVQYQVEKLIVGISESEMAQKTRLFIADISRQYPHLDIEEADETLSTYEAVSRMRSLKKTKREGNRDHYAATMILQNYIDLHPDQFPL